RKSKLRSTRVQLPGPANHLSFCFSSAKAAKTRAGRACQRRVMVKLAWVTERDILLSFEVMKTDGAVLEWLVADTLQFGPVRNALQIGDARPEQDRILENPEFVDRTHLQKRVHQAGTAENHQVLSRLLLVREDILGIAP